MDSDVLTSTCSLFSPFFLLLLHEGCFFFFSSTCISSNKNNVVKESNPNQQQQQLSWGRKISPIISPSPSTAKPRSSLAVDSSLESPDSGSPSLSIRSYLKHLFSITSKSRCHQQQQRQQQSGVPSTISPSSHPHELVTTTTCSKRTSFASRADVFPCPSCGEVFNRVHLLDLHQATKHALAELVDGESGKNIVRIIFQSGWKGKKGSIITTNSYNNKNMGSMLFGVDRIIPTVHRILRIQNTPKTIARFEEYREMVKSRAAARAAENGRQGDEERCIADGNERLRFYCATYLCSLGKERDSGEGKGVLGTCGSPFCSTCGIVRHGFGGKGVAVDGIATQGTGWAAHSSLPDEVEEEFAFMHVRRAILVCRVVAGRVRFADVDVDKKEEGGGGCLYDSVAVTRKGTKEEEDDEEVLVVSNPRAVLPCFVILYTV